MNSVIDFLQKLETVKKSDEVANLCKTLCRQLSISYYMPAIFYPHSMQRSHLFHLTNYPDAWVKYYLEKDLKKVDQIVLHSWYADKS